MAEKMQVVIKDQEHFKAVQEAAFAMGYLWCGGSGEVRNTPNIGIVYFESNMTLEWNSNRTKVHDYPDYEVAVLFDGKIILKSNIATVAEPVERLPLWLRPKYVVDALRVREVVDAIQRYGYADKQIPQAWLDELAELNSKLKA